MVKLASTLNRLNPKKIMVIGDLLLDMYTLGKARRISPEAPVAILHVQNEDNRPGGAGNVALNLVSLGANIVMVGRVGNDWGGECLKESFESEKIGTNAIFIQENYKTPIKNRIIAENQQIVRVDYEQVTSLSENLEQIIIETLPHLMEDVKMIAISDYGKGFLTKNLLRAIIHLAKQKEIPVISDPKGHDFSKYHGTTIIKPNLSEAYMAANLPSHAPLEEVAEKIIQITAADMLMVTRSEAGISIFHADGKREDCPVQIKQIKDVTGAGDTVLAMLTYALSNQLSYFEAGQLCNVAAGIAIEQIGCARVTLAELAHRLLERDVSNKIFDEDHLFALQEVLQARTFNLLLIEDVQDLSQNLYRVIKNLSSKKSSLLIHVLDAEPNEGFIEILTSLKEVDFILLHQDSLKQLCSKVYPVETYLFRKNQVNKIESLNQLFERVISLK